MDESARPGIEAAIDAWRAALGSAHVLVDEATRNRYSSTTLRSPNKVAAIVRPGSTAQVQQVMRIASAHRIPVYPISGGKNWGFGSRVPVEDHNIVLDLGRMDQVVDHDERLAYVTVEPGVTHRTLAKFLQEHGLRLWMDTTSVTADGSVLGNTMERGHGFTPYADHVGTACGYEVVLPTGELIRTGHGRFGTEAMMPVDPWPAGPSLMGLFSQSNLGVVTKLSVWLMPQPEAARIFYLSIADDEQLLGIIDTLRELRLDGTIAAGPRCSNIFRSLMYGDFPADLIGPGAAITKAQAQKLGAERGLPAWSLCFGAYGTKPEVEQRRARIEDIFRGRVAALRSLNEAELADLPAPEAKRYIGAFTLLTGRLPSAATEAVRRMYWRKRTLPQDHRDPDADRCGFIWLAPVTRFEAEDVDQVRQLVEDVLPRHGFEPDIAFFGLRPRTLHFHVSIVYDRDEPGADARALAAHDELADKLLAAGFPPYRLGIQSMSLMNRTDPTFQRVYHQIKQALDPHGILAPGRYAPGTPGSGS